MAEERAEWESAKGAKRKQMVRDWVAKQFDQYTDLWALR